MSNSLPASLKMRSATATPPAESLRLVVAILLVARGSIHVLRIPPYGRKAFTQLEKIVTPRAAVANRIESLCAATETGL